MTEALTYRSIILNEGKFAIGQGLVQAKRLKPHSFRVGDAFDFTPTEDGKAVSGNLVYTGPAAQINGSILAKDTFRFALTFPEKAGDFTIGNIILYMQADDGTVFPFIWVVSKIPYLKQAIQPNSIGNRFVFNLIEKIINVNDVLALTVQAPAFFSLAGYVTEKDLPKPTQALFQQFFVQQPTIAPFPFVGARRSVDNSYWGFPLYSRVDEPFFGRLDGGRAGEPRNMPYQGRYFWGGRLRFRGDQILFKFGGSKLSDRTFAYNIGGEKLPPNRGYAVTPLT